MSDATTIYKLARSKFGMNNQLVAAIEEFAELQQVLCKFILNKELTVNALVDEIADATIMLEQVRYNMIEAWKDRDDLDALIEVRKKEKLQRLLNRINFK